MPYKYHPAWSIPFAVLSVFPERIAFVAFDFAMLACWVWGAKIWARRIGYRHDPIKSLLLLLVSFNALSSELNLGQINGLLFLGAAKIFEWLDGKQQRWFAAGFLVVVLVSIKLSFGILAVFCFLRNVRTLLGMLAAGVFLHLVTACFFGDWLSLELYRSWIEVLLGQSSQQYADPNVQGVLRFWLSVTGVETSQRLWILTGVAAIGFGAYLERNRRNDTILIDGYWMTAVYLLSPLAWWNQILFSLPLAYVLLRKPDLAPVSRGILYAVLVIYAVASPTLLGRAIIEAFRDHNGLFLVCMAIVAVMVAHVWNQSALSEKEAGMCDTARP